MTDVPPGDNSRKRRSRFDQEPSEPPAKRPSRFTDDSGAAAPSSSSAAPPSSSAPPKAGEGGAKPALTLAALQKAKEALQKHKAVADKLKNNPKLQALAQAKAAAAAGTAAKPAPLPTHPTIPLPVPGPSSVPAVDPNIQKVRELANSLVRAGGLAGAGPSAPSTADVLAHLGAAASARPALQTHTLRLDAQGREVDEHGNLVERVPVAATSTLKVNITKEKLEKFALDTKGGAGPKESSFVDERMNAGAGPKQRKQRASFSFVKPGVIQRTAFNSRIKNIYGESAAKQMMEKEKMERRAAAAARAFQGDPSNIPLGLQKSIGLLDTAEGEEEEQAPSVTLDPIPAVEWWDAPLLPSKAYEDVTGAVFKMNSERINIYVEHPIPVAPPNEPPPPPPQPLKLTRRENKKLKTQRRLMREKERQELIKQGLLEPPKPKVKISNLHKVMGMEATMDPTAIEKEVRAQMEERQTAHDDRNLARKLTSEERKDKKARKMFEDVAAPEDMAALYKIRDLSCYHNQWKVDINAQENHLTGMCLLVEDGDFSLVLVEGTAKALKRYNKLMLRRIDWSEKGQEDGAGDDDDDDEQPNQCVLIWQGAVQEFKFTRFKLQKCATAGAAQKVLKDAGVGHYWDLAKTCEWEGIQEVQ